MTIRGIAAAIGSCQKRNYSIIHEALINGVTIAVKYQSKNKAFPGDYLLHPGGYISRQVFLFNLCL